MDGGDEEPAVHVLRSARDEVGARRPVAPGGAVPVRDPLGEGQRLEMLGRALALARSPGGEAADPVRDRDEHGRLLDGRVGQGEGLGVLAVIEIAGRDVGAHPVDLDLVEELPGLGRLEQVHGAGGPAAADARPHGRLQLPDAIALGLGELLLGLVDREARILGHPAAEDAAARRARRHRRGRLAPHGQTIDARGFRVIGVERQPIAKLAVFRAVLRRVQIALGEQVAEEDVVLELGDLAVGRAPLAGLLKAKDGPVGLGVLEAQNFWERGGAVVIEVGREGGCLQLAGAGRRPGIGRLRRPDEGGRQK